MIAEAFAKREGIEADSAGTDATGPIFDEVKQLVRERDLEDYVDYNPEQISQEKIDRTDKIICMTDDQEEFIQEIYGVDPESVNVWKLEDRDPGEDLEQIIEEIFRKVKEIK